MALKHPNTQHATPSKDVAIAPHCSHEEVSEGAFGR
jgi:hypothetical protein